MAGTPAWNVIQTNYPTVVGNRAVLEANGVGHNAAYRAIAATNSGTIFVAAIVAYQYDGATEGANKYMTIGLMNDTDTELEFGKVYGRQNFFDIRRSGANGTVSTRQMHGWGESGRSTNDWYWMVVKYDFSAGGGTAYANCYYQGQNIPYEEPTTWDVEWSGMGISEIDGIELKGGSFGSGWLGGAIWDEIRISSVWPSLIGQPNLQPWPSPVDFGEVESTLSSNLTVWIANLGGDNVPLIATNEYAFNLTGPDAGYFALATNRFSSILTLGQSNGLGVTFWPTNAGVVEYTNAWLMVSNNSGLNPYPIQLMGLGVPTVSTNEPVVSNYFVGEGRWLTDAMVTSGVFAVTAEVYHVRGIRTATYDLLNGDGDVILANEAFATWSSTDGFSFVLSDAAHPGYWPATPSTNYHLRVNLESSNLIAAAQTIYTADGVVTAPDLFFSEYVEGTSDNKALEIFNGTGVATNLSNYGIRFKMNNSADWDTFYDYMALPDVVLQPGAAFVIAHSNAEASLLARANYVTGNICSFNGNDSIFLMKGIGEEEPLDAIGASPSGGDYAIDTTLYRRSSVTNPAAVYNELEWTNLAAIAYTNLGTHAMDGTLGKPMVFTVDDDDVESPEIGAATVAGVAPSESAPGPDIVLTNVPASGLPVTWSILDAESGVFAASNRYVLRTGLTVVASGWVTAGADGDGQAAALPVSVDMPKALLPGGDYELVLSGVDYDPEFADDPWEDSHQFFFRILSPVVGTAPASLDFGQVGVGLTSNLTLVVTNSGNVALNVSDFEFVGSGFAFFDADVDSLVVEPGTASNVVVSFVPTGGGTFYWTMILHNDSGNAPALEVPLTGSCYDPETMPPEIVDYAIVDLDAATETNEVTDHAAANGEITASFTLYHLMGVQSGGATFDLLYPDGTLALSDVPLAATGTATNDGAVCTVFTGFPTAFYPATLGVYTARVTAVSSNGIPMTDEIRFSTSGGGVQVLTETFNSVTNNTVYQNGIATGGDWGVWSFTQTRWDQTLNGKAPTVRAGGTLVAPVLSNGCTQITFDYKRPYSESGAFNVDVLVNETVVGTVTAMPPNTTTIYTHQIDGLNFSGDVVISFTNKATGTTKRMAIDNIEILTLGTATNEIMTVDVVDEDATGPAHSGFNVDAAMFTTNQFLPGGLVVTGLVMDSQSGVFAASNTWTLYSNSIPVANGTFTMDPAADGAGISNVAAGLSATIPGDLLNWVPNGQFSLIVTSTDYDGDRPDDWTQNSTEFTFGIAEYVSVPTNFAAAADGPEMVVMSWDLNEASAGLLLWSTNPITSGPIKGETYDAGDEIGTAVVAYHGSREALEIVVPIHSTNYFRLYGAAGTTYSAAYVVPETHPVETLNYERGEIVDQFAYTNNYYVGTATNFVYLSDQEGLATGQGWNGAWFGDDLDLFSVDDTNLLAGTIGYPTPYANKLQWVYNHNAPVTGAVYRALATPRSGRTFVAFMMNYKTADNQGANKFVGLSLMGTATNACDREEIFFGKPAGAGNMAGIYEPGTAHEEASATYAITADHFADYMIVGEWEPTNHTIRMWAFHRDGGDIPEIYSNATPIAVYSNDAISVGTITGIRLAAGVAAEAGSSLDHVYFDEVRVGATWDEVLNFTYPNVYNYWLEGHTNLVSDGQLVEPTNSYPVTFSVYHRRGVQETRFTLLDLESTNWLYNPVIFAGLSNSVGSQQIFTNVVTNRLTTNVVELATYTSRVWAVSTSGKETNTIVLAEQAGATDLFFGEFGEGEGYDKYVELYNATGGDIDLYDYYLAVQMNPSSAVSNDYRLGTWQRQSQLATAPATTILPSGQTILVLNGYDTGKIGISNSAVSTQLIAALGSRPYILGTNKIFEANGNDPIGLFHVGSTNWIDACGISYGELSSQGRYIMQRVEDSEVPRYSPLVVDTNEWDYRRWALSGSSDRPAYTNFVQTAGLYDRQVGVGGYITFRVYDDDQAPPTVGTNGALKVGASEPYTDLTQQAGEHEAVFCAWSFTNATIEEALRPWGNSLLTNAAITWTAAYTDEMFRLNSNGTGENDVFDGYGQANKGEIYMRNVGGTHWDFGPTNVPWIQFELPLMAAEDIVLSWAEAGGAYSFTNVSLQWSATGEEGSFATNAAWRPWTMTDLSSGEWRSRFVEFSNAVPAGISRVYLRFVLGPGHGGAAGNTNGAFRLDNVQLTGRPYEYEVTDGQIADSGYALRMQGNVYDASGIQADQSVMAIGAKSGTRNAAKSTGDGRSEDSTLWWDVEALSQSELTDWVLTSDAGSGIPMTLEVPDDDTDRANDVSQFSGSLGRLRVADDDRDRPRLTLQTMRPRMGILAQWLFTGTNSLLPTRADGSIETGPIRTETLNGAVSSPRFVAYPPTNNTWAVRQSGWHYQSKYWAVEMTPETDMGVTNLSFQTWINKTNGPTHAYIRHFVNGVSNASWGPINFNGGLPPATDVWYSCSYTWPTNNPLILTNGATNQIRIHCMGGTSNSIGTYLAIYNLTLLQGAVGTNGITEVTDQEFAEGSFKLQGATWDDDSGIRSTNTADAAKRPRYSMNAPNGSVFATNVSFAFADGEIADGEVTQESEGGFEAALPQPVYTNVMLGEYLGRASVWDYDQDRTEDDLQMTADLAMYVVDNDIGIPSPVGTVQVNGLPVGPLTRESAPWTNTPEFIVTMDAPAMDNDPGIAYSAKQRMLTGIGEYRVTTNDVSGMTASNRVFHGTPYAVATTNGALANYGFEMLNVSWTLDGDCSYHRYNLLGDLVRPWEGTNCLKQTGSGTAYQWIEFLNTNAVTPSVGVGGRYRIASGATPTLRIEAFAADNLVTPVATRDVTPGTSASWASFGAATNPIGDTTVAALKISLIGNGGTATYWDDLRLSVDIGNNRPSMRFLATVANQGIGTTNYLFAVDADNNRAGDRMGGVGSPFVIPYDVTPPTAVGASVALAALTDTVDDPTTQFDLQWNTAQVGPDDPAHANHPTKAAADRDILSPWRSYKIYFGTFDPLDVPVGDGGPGTADAYVYTNFVHNGAYRAWSNVAWNSTIEDPSAASTNYLALTNRLQTRIRLFDLDYDQEYVVVIVGVDKAGNEGPAGIYSWATNNTIKFALTRGWTLPKDEALAYFPDATTSTLARIGIDRAAGLAWLAAGNTNPLATGISNRYINVSKDYDLIYWDSATFQESINNDWKLLGTVRTNWFADDGGQARGRGQIRFYRASYKDRWRKTRQIYVSNEWVTVSQRPLASEEVYALHNIILSPGPNFVAFHGIPYTNTLNALFGGLESFPGGASMGEGATVVEFYSAGTNAIMSEQFWLDDSGLWKTAGGTDVTHVVQPADFFNRGFSINLPPAAHASWETYGVTNALDYNRLDASNRPAVVPAMIWSAIAQVPTNSTGFTQTIHCGSRRNPIAPVFNVVALRLPVAAHPSQLKLPANFVRGKTTGDLIYSIDTRTKDVLAGSLIYCDTNDVWHFDYNDDLVGWGHFRPNDVIVIVSRNGGLGNTWTWSYEPTDFYELPTRWMGWTETAPAAEPTANATSLAFADVSATQIGVSWTSGNGARRIVVVKAGSVPDWTPTDAVPPSGVNSDFSAAVDQGNGSKICYDGTGGGFLLRILQPSTTYYFKVYEYNGTGTGVNYLTTGAVLSGYQLTQ